MMIWMKRFFTDLGGTYLDSLRAIKALPWLFAAIIGWEFAQHIVEVRIGMFESKEMARAVADDGLRMAFGWVKMASIYVGAFFVIRHFVSQRSDRVLAPLRSASLKYLPYLVYSLLAFAAIFYAPSILPEAHVDSFRTTIGLGQPLLEPLLIAWVVSAATDGRIGGPIASARRLGLLYLLALPFLLLARLPVSLLHQDLNQTAMGSTGAELWLTLAIDAVVVGIIASIVPAAMVRVAGWIELRKPHKRQLEPAAMAA